MSFYKKNAKIFKDKNIMLYKESIKIEQGEWKKILFKIKI